METHSLKALQHDIFLYNGSTLSHGFFNCHGGNSPPPFSTNNVSYGVGDDEKAIVCNRHGIKTYLGVSLLLSAHQTHGDKIFHLQENALDKDLEVMGFDALITSQRDIGLMVQQADCQAILLFDPQTMTIGAIHCGWRGSVNGIIGKTIRRMETVFSVKPENLKAVISPSLGPCCAEFVNYKQELPPEFERFLVKENYFDFWQISRWQLLEHGLQPSWIGISTICTSCSPDYFSYRRASRESDGITGRNCSVIALT